MRAEEVQAAFIFNLGSRRLASCSGRFTPWQRSQIHIE